MKKTIAITLLIFISVSSIAQTAGEWKLVWQDEFNYTGLPDSSKWSYEVGHIRNNEQQYYTRARKENIWVERGILTITGRKESFVNERYKPGSTSWQQKDSLAQYTSASINTSGKVGWKYGRLEISARLPKGAGIWPALWMLGIDRNQVGWPGCGEIDIMEFIGNHPENIHGTIHYKDTTNHKHASSGAKISRDTTDDKFHIYAIEWDEEKIDIFYDGKKYHSFYIDLAGRGDSNAFRKPFYLLTNLAMGSQWPGPIDDAVLPQRFEVDYVRIYK